MFKRIEIKNVRTCEHVVLENLGGVVALLGRNGSGKTNILMAIAWAARAAVSNDSAKLSDLPIVSFEIVLGTATYIYTFSFQRLIEDNEGRPKKFTSHLLESLSLVNECGSHLLLATRENENVRISSQSNENPIRISISTPLLSALKSLLAPEDEVLPHILTVFRFLERVRYYGAESDDVLRGTEPSSIVRGEDYRKWLEHSGAMDDPRQPTMMRLLRLFEQDTDRFEDLEKLVRDRLGVIDRIVVATMSMSDATITSAQPEIYSLAFVPAYSMALVGLEELSHGTRRVLMMVLSLILDESSVYLFEQPEDGIHAGLTEKLAGLLRAYAGPAQIILATHSTVLLNQLHPDEVRLVTIDTGKTAVRSLSDQERSVAQKYLTQDGTLSEFLSLVEEG